MFDVPTKPSIERIQRIKKTLSIYNEDETKENPKTLEKRDSAGLNLGVDKSLLQKKNWLDYYKSLNQKKSVNNNNENFI